MPVWFRLQDILNGSTHFLESHWATRLDCKKVRDTWTRVELSQLKPGESFVLGQTRTRSAEYWSITDLWISKWLLFQSTETKEEGKLSCFTHFPKVYPLLILILRMANSPVSHISPKCIPCWYWFCLILIFSAQYCLLFPGQIFLSLSFSVATLCGLWDLSSLIVIKLAPPALGTWSLNHQKIREVPDITLISVMFPKSQVRWGEAGRVFFFLVSTLKELCINWRFGDHSLSRSRFHKGKSCF